MTARHGEDFAAAEHGLQVGLLQAPPTALYIHIPWCVKKCPYCDFNSHERRGASQESEYVDALIADLDADLSAHPGLASRAIESVFFGGGTPSLFAPESIARILAAARDRLQFISDCEITLETNPGTVEHGRFDGYAAAGVNRISFGIQTFDDAALKRIGRIHGADEARNAVRAAQAAGIHEINIDLMYALPEQSLAQAIHDVDEALRLAPTHLSHYQLTLEPNTIFAARPPQHIPDEDASWDMQERCQERIAAGGFAQYEVSAYAQAGHACRHNLNYWQFGDYLGIGAGAHAKLTDVDAQTIARTWKLKQPNAYLQHAGGAKRVGGREDIERAQLPFEFMLNALRLNSGFALDTFESRTGLARSSINTHLRTAQQKGWIDPITQHWVRPTALGSRFLNDLIELFLD